jgi:dienelactone hydrolase
MNSRVSFRFLASSLCLALFASTAGAKLVAKNIDYVHEGTKLSGYLAYDDAKSGPRPGVLVVHEWWGLNDYTRGRANQLAEMGYVAFAVDMFGNGKTTVNPAEAKDWSSAVAGKPGMLAARSKAGLEILRQQSQTDKAHLAAIGFCFGGSTVLQLAYSGEPLDSVVTFHGGLMPPDDAQAKQIKTRILILHGAEDTFTKPETIDAVRKTLDAAKVDWYMVTYANAVHAFSNPDADSYKIQGIGYNEAAATRSWGEMRRFFREKWTKP